MFPDHAARDYDERIGRLVPGYRLAIELMVSSLAAHRSQPARILVPGCGTGSELVAAALVLPDARFTAVDPSAGMLDLARHKAKAGQLHERFEFHQGVLDELSVDAHDAAMLSLVLHFLPDTGPKRNLLMGIAARLRKGGPLLLVDAIETGDGDSALGDWLERKGHKSAEAAAVIERMQGTWHRTTEDRLNRLLEQAGFRVKEPFFQAFGYLGIQAEKA